ncbi:MAG: dTDP-4-dehydrorhamnose 3,5-epimerase [Candidatus Zixiibacteriota bacterium]
MKITKTKLEGLIIVETELFQDERGFFTESYSKKTYEKFGLNYEIVQDNHSRSINKDTIRGLHYQLNPKAQSKIIKVLKGSIIDVSVDIRKGSPTFGKWEKVVLSDTNLKQLIVPKGFANGFCSLEPETEVYYKVDEYYAPEYERSIIWNDPQLAIDWPANNPILSDKDKKAPLFKDAEIDFTFGDYQ